MHKLFIIFVNLAILLSYSCNDEPMSHPTVEKPPIDFKNMQDGETIAITYSENKGKNSIQEYRAVKIGEYLWMNSNFTDPVERGHDITQHQINKCLSIYEIDTTIYPVTVNEFNKYFGQYYSRSMIERISGIGNMYEGEHRLDNGKWDLPKAAAFRQLFGMCGNASEHDVRTTLCYKTGEIPIMRTTKNAFWIDNNNTNKYGFNLVYSGGRCHANKFPWGVCLNPGNCQQYLGNLGDLYTFYGAVMYPAAGGITVKISDFPDTREGKIWAWLPVRWSRRLTAKELGYELYTNKERNVIIELSSEETSPNGYEILPDGYLRGFYLQYILNNPNPVMTVPQLREMEKNLEEIKRGTPLS